MTISPEQLDTAVRRYLGGETLKAVAEDMKIPLMALRGAVERLGVHRPRIRSGPLRKLSSDRESLIVSMYRDGRSGNSIAKELGIPATTVRRTLLRLGADKNAAFEKSEPLADEQKDLVVEECLYGETLDDVARLLDVSKSTITRALRERGVELGRGRRPRFCTVDESVFDDINPLSARWMGFLFADGALPQYADQRGQQPLAVNISAKDRPHLEKFRAFLRSSHAITTIHVKEREIDGRISPAIEAAHYRVRSNRLVEALVCRGMIREKGPLRTPTDELSDLPWFWAGCVDGDGWLGNTLDRKRGEVIPFIGLCGHMPLLEKFQSFIRRRGIGEANITPTESGIFRVQFGGQTALRVIELLYSDDSAAAGLDRKIARSRQILRGEKVDAYETVVQFVTQNMLA